MTTAQQPTAINLYRVEVMGPSMTTINFVIDAESVDDARARLRNLGHEALIIHRAYEPWPIGAWARAWADAHGLGAVA